jgi:hypothetical protein
MSASSRRAPSSTRGTNGARVVTTGATYAATAVPSGDPPDLLEPQAAAMSASDVSAPTARRCLMSP